LLREGGGQLSDDIPPPAPEERALTETENNPPDEMLIPGLDLLPVAVVPAVRPAPRSRSELEAERLRALLTEALHELESLRALMR
jgi:hypothetical protein